MELLEAKDLITKIITEHQEHWKWRFEVASLFAGTVDFEYLGIYGIYLIGSAKNATSGPNSDIDLIIHSNSKPSAKNLIKKEVEKWDELTRDVYLNLTGSELPALFDLHLVTDRDIKQKNSFAVMLSSLENSARPLKVIKL